MIKQCWTVNLCNYHIGVEVWGHTQDIYRGRGMGPHTGHRGMGMGSHTGHRGRGMGSHTGHRGMGMGSHTGHRDRGMGSHTGHRGMGMGSHTGHRGRGMGSHTGHRGRGMGSHTGHRGRGMGSRTQDIWVEVWGHTCTEQCIMGIIKITMLSYQSTTECYSYFIAARSSMNMWMHLLFTKRIFAPSTAPTQNPVSSGQCCKCSMLFMCMCVL